MEKTKAPGLKWIKRASGLKPVWVADENDVKNGYAPKTVNLSHMAGDPDMLVAKCNSLQAEMMLWRTGYRREALAFDGTIRALLEIYQRHDESPYQSLKPSSRRVYNHYLGRLETHIGSRRIDVITGVDILRWHKIWSSEGEHLAAATISRAVLDAALAFGVMSRLAGCPELSVILRETRRKLPRPGARTNVLLPEHVEMARAAAHKAGRPSRALAYAIAFETTLRLWDVIGQWWPIDQGGLSDVIDEKGQLKWFGLRWEDIDDAMVVSYRPSKTEQTTSRTISYPLTKAPMVLEELAHWPVEKRKGPIIVSEKTGLPYKDRRFSKGWQADRTASGIDGKVWARDLRASGITEGRASDASIDDAAKVAGHSGTKTTEDVYDRAVLEAADRFAQARLNRRETKPKPSR